MNWSGCASRPSAAPSSRSGGGSGPSAKEPGPGDAARRARAGADFRLGVLGGFGPAHGDDPGPEPGVGRQHAVIAVAVDAGVRWRAVLPSGVGFGSRYRRRASGEASEACPSRAWSHSRATSGQRQPHQQEAHRVRLHEDWGAGGRNAQRDTRSSISATKLFTSTPPAMSVPSSALPMSLARTNR